MKKYHSIEKQTENPFLNMYHMNAIDRGGKSFDYYFASRNDTEQLKLNTHELNPEGIVIYAVTEETVPRLVLIRQYRYPIGEYLYEMPAGLVDEGETPEEAAEREMLEETGFTFSPYSGGASLYRRPFFMGPGFTDETCSAVFGTVSGEPGTGHAEAAEDIHVQLADKKQVWDILSRERISLRGAYLMMNFLHAEGPFSFLLSKS